MNAPIRAQRRRQRPCIVMVLLVAVIGCWIAQGVKMKKAVPMTHAHQDTKPAKLGRLSK